MNLKKISGIIRDKWKVFICNCILEGGFLNSFSSRNRCDDDDDDDDDDNDDDLTVEWREGGLKNV